MALIPISSSPPAPSFPLTLDPLTAAQSGYLVEIARAAAALQQRMSVLIECEKEVVDPAWQNIKCAVYGIPVESYDAPPPEPMLRPAPYLDPRLIDGVAPPPPPGMPAPRMLDVMLSQLREVLSSGDVVPEPTRRDAAGNVLPAPPQPQVLLVFLHLDLLTGGGAGQLSDAMREVTAQLAAFPSLPLLAFHDPTIPIPPAVAGFFQHKETLGGVSRDLIHTVVTRDEALRFSDGGVTVNTNNLYKHLSGVNPVRMRRILPSIHTSIGDFDAAVAQLRLHTSAPGLQIPSVTWDQIGGYDDAKREIQSKILEPLAKLATVTDERKARQLEEDLPKGVIFYGPPGTGKSQLAKAIATSLGAVVKVVAASELVSMWLGESEANVRRIFAEARKAAPSLIIFDEFDAIGRRRGGSAPGTHSDAAGTIVNQLLTEMDGFHDEELVFFVGTTNNYLSLDEAFLRPGRFGLQIEIGYPDDDARRHIVGVYNRRMDLRMTPDAVDRAVELTGRILTNIPPPNNRQSGDHIRGLCAAINRARFMGDKTGDTTPADVSEAFGGVEEEPISENDRIAVATHECGHAVVAQFCPFHPPIHRISLIRNTEMAGSVEYIDRTNIVGHSQLELLDRIASLMGGRVAEEIYSRGNPTTGAMQDLAHATHLARLMVEGLGMGGSPMVTIGMDGRQHPGIAESTRSYVDGEVARILAEQKERAGSIIQAHAQQIRGLRAALLERNVLERAAIEEILGAKE